MTPNLVRTYDDHAAGDTTRESVSQIAASIASRLARSRDGGVLFDETQQGSSVSVLNEAVCANNSDRLEGNNALNQVRFPKMSRDQLQHPKLLADEYRARADACLNWAREAPSDEARLACITLAQTWLKAAIRDEEDAAEGLPLAPTL
jgi:hypothetical protein